MRAALEQMSIRAWFFGQITYLLYVYQKIITRDHCFQLLKIGIIIGDST